jgi:hypothetical protein
VRLKMKRWQRFLPMMAHIKERTVDLVSERCAWSALACARLFTECAIDGAG